MFPEAYINTHKYLYTCTHLTLLEWEMNLIKLKDEFNKIKVEGYREKY